MAVRRSSVHYGKPDYSKNDEKQKGKENASDRQIDGQEANREAKEMD